MYPHNFPSIVKTALLWNFMSTGLLIATKGKAIVKTAHPSSKFLIDWAARTLVELLYGSRLISTATVQAYSRSLSLFQISSAFPTILES